MISDRTINRTAIAGYVFAIGLTVTQTLRAALDIALCLLG